MNAPTKLERCRLSGSTNLIPVADFGDHALSGVFPRPGDPPVMRGPLGLCWCPDSGLLQLDHVYDPADLYSDGYGYRSGLNASMVRHLHAKARKLEQMAGLKAGDVVLDIGSNDGTLLGGYRTGDLWLVGIDPTATKFMQHYPPRAKVIPNFFAAPMVRSVTPARAKLITSVAMLYDLDDPLTFARDVADCLAPDGLWHLEVAYMPAMLRSGAYDAVCQEHACYYSMRTLMTLLVRSGFKVVDWEFNDVNGGSVAITASRWMAAPVFSESEAGLEIPDEDGNGFSNANRYFDFARAAAVHRGQLQRLLTDLQASGARILCYGASTKGNTLLQYCGIGPDLVTAAAEVNPDKFGCLTATGIPIVSEDEARAMEPTHYLVLPHHFRAGILERERAFREKGGKFIFPFPIEVV